MPMNTWQEQLAGTPVNYYYYYYEHLHADQYQTVGCAYASSDKSAA